MDNILLNSNARVFIAEKGAGCGREYVYYNCMKMGGVDKSFGEVTPIYCPGDIGGEFEQVDSYRGDESPWNTSLAGYKILGARSVLQRLSRRKTPIDVQVHFGTCVDLSDFGSYESAIIIEDATFSGYNVDNLGALNSGETAPVMETVNLAAANIYEVFCVKLLEVARGQTQQGVVAAVTTCPEGCATDCLVPCSTFYAWRFNGDPDFNGNNITIMRSTDGGIVWRDYAFTTPTFNMLSAPLHSFHIACSGKALFVIGNEADDHAGAIYRIPLSDFDDGELSEYRRIEISTQINAVHIAGGKLWVLDDSGTLTAVNTDSLSITQEPLGVSGFWEFMSMVDENNFLLGSVLGSISAYRNGVISTIDCLTLAGVDDTCQISAVVMRNSDEWFVATCGGGLHCTTDAGRTWRTVVNSASPIVDIKFSTKNVGYYLTRSPCRVYRTIDGGATWDLVDDYSWGVNPDLGFWHGLTVCSHDPNVFVATGRVTLTTPEDCAEGGCQHACELVADTDRGILVSSQIC
jgi:hypothetical protein